MSSSSPAGWMDGQELDSSDDEGAGVKQSLN